MRCWGCDMWLIFTRDHSIESLLVRVFCWSTWSHVGIIVGDDVLQVLPGRGVHLVPLREVKAAATHWQIGRIDCEREEEITRLALGEIGKRYDWLGVFGFLLRRRLERGSRWFCSELIAWAAEQAGEPIFRVKPWHVTPRDLWMVSK